MEIKSTLTSHTGQTLDVIYRDLDSSAELGERKVSGVHGYCFFGDKLVVVYAKDKGYWTPPGGGVEAGESPEEALIREIKEETNMRVISQKFIGYQDIFEPTGTVTQTRSLCTVEPIGKFVSDPDGDITEIKLIEPNDYKKYFDWGEIGERIMERVLQLKNSATR